MRQLILDLAWDPLPPFAGFLPGDNAAVVGQLREQSWPGAPLYLWGPAGCGKTQLLRELQARAVESGLVAQWFDASSPTPWELADDAALVLLDGVDQWSDAQQHAAFTLFVEAASRVGGVMHETPWVPLASPCGRRMPKVSKWLGGTLPRGTRSCGRFGSSTSEGNRPGPSRPISCSGSEPTGEHGDTYKHERCSLPSIPVACLGRLRGRMRIERQCRFADRKRDQ